MAAAPGAAVPAALQRQLRALLLPGGSDGSAAALAARLRAVAAALEAPPPPAPPATSPAAADAAAAAGGEASAAAEEGGPPAAKRRVVRLFDLANYPTAFVALELFYAGWQYHGFATQGYGADAAETVETHLFAALRATRLIGAESTWSQCGYSRCGRTDKGVSALRQLVALRVRAAAPGAEALDYVALLNRQLPADIRVLSWRPAPQDFSARFSARWRQYKYFFWDDGAMDLDAMQDAAARLVGTHDFRNLCKMDVANVKNFVRTILFFSVEAESPPAGAASSVTGRLMSLNVRGNAFLYHQVRCMASVLFTIGRRLEPPSLIDTLLDVAALPRKPAYEMAAEEPLLFFACGYEDGTLPPPRRGAGRTRGILAAHLRAEARRAAVRAAVVRAAADAVAAAEAAEDHAGDPAVEPLAEARHVPFLSRLREASYEEQWAKYSAKAAARGEAAREGEDEG